MGLDPALGLTCLPPSSPPDCESSSSALRAPRPGKPSAEPAPQAQAEAPMEAPIVETDESVARGSLTAAAAELARSPEVAIALFAAVLRPAVAESFRVEVALSTPLLTSAMLVFFRLSTEEAARCAPELMPAATLAEAAAAEAVAVSRALCSAPDTTSIPMPMPMPDARRRASMTKRRRRAVEWRHAPRVQ